MRSPGDKEWDSSGISLFLSCLHSPFWFHSLTDFLHTHEGVEASSPMIMIFPSFSICPSPNTSLGNPREALRLAQFGSHTHVLGSVYGSESKRPWLDKLWVLCPLVRVCGVGSRCHEGQPPLESLGWSWRNRFPSQTQNRVPFPQRTGVENIKQAKMTATHDRHKSHLKFFRCPKIMLH